MLMWRRVEISSKVHGGDVGFVNREHGLILGPQIRLLV